MKNWLGVLVLGLAALSGSTGAFAHSLEQSTSSWLMVGDRIHMRFVVPQVESLRLSPPDLEESSLTAVVTAQLDGTIHVQRGGKLCARLGPSRGSVSARGMIEVDSDFECAAEGRLELSIQAFFTVSPSHVHLAHVSVAKGGGADLVFTASDSRHTVELRQPGAPSSWLGTLWRFLSVGVTHIATGPDHLGFLLGLLLLAPSTRWLLGLTGGFTLGHSTTLALVALQIVRPDAPVIEALVGFSVLLVAAEAVSKRSESPRIVLGACVVAVLLVGAASLFRDPGIRKLPIIAGLLVLTPAYFAFSGGTPRGQARYQFGMTVVFGLIHGMAFASGLQELDVPRASLLPALAGFNIGVEIGQIGFVAAALSVSWAFGVVVGQRTAKQVAATVASMLCAAGAAWFAVRLVQA